MKMEIPHSPKLMQPNRRKPSVRLKTILRSIGIYPPEHTESTKDQVKHGSKPIQRSRSAVVKKVNFREDDTMKIRRVNSDRPPRNTKPEILPKTITQPRKSLPTLSTISTSSGDKSPSVPGKNGFLDPNSSMSASKTDDESYSQTTPSPTMTTRKVNGQDLHYQYPSVSKSRKEQFHKLFQSVPDDEFPIDYYSCAFKGDILLQGLLYVSHNWICFYSKIKGRGRRLEIPLSDVISITREKTALVFPNAIGIQTADAKIVFVSFMSRDSTYRLLETLWKRSIDLCEQGKVQPLKTTIEFENSEKCSSSESSLIENDTSDSELNVCFACTCRSVANNMETSKETTTKKHKSCLKCEPNNNMDQQQQPKVEKIPFLYIIKCFDRHETFNAFCKFKVRLQTIPRTNLLLAICSILVFFLLVSAVGLAYKILVLQAKMDMEQTWKPHYKHYFRDQMMGQAYSVKMETHASTIKHLHSVIKANIQLLEEVHDSLKSLQSGGAKTTCSTKECP